MATTPVYAWPYQGLSDSPNGAILGENLALGIEATVGSIDSRVTATEAFDARIDVLEAAKPYKDEHVCVGTEATVVFSSIPSTLKTVHVRWTTRSDNGAIQFLYGRINADSGANYNYQYGQTSIATPGGNGLAAQTAAVLGFVMGTDSTAGWFSSGVLDIEGWNAPHANHLNMTHVGKSLGSSYFAVYGGADYLGAGPYTSITFLPSAGSFVAGTAFYLTGER